MLERDACAGPHEGLTKPFDHAGDGREAERERDLAAKAARGDENESPNSLRAVEQHRLSDSAAEGVADDVDSIEMERFEPSGRDARVPAEFVARVGVPGEAVARQVRYENPPVAHERCAEPLPRAMTVRQPVKQHDGRIRARIAQLDPVQRAALDIGEAVRLFEVHIDIVSVPVQHSGRRNARGHPLAASLLARDDRARCSGIDRGVSVARTVHRVEG